MRELSVPAGLIMSAACCLSRTQCRPEQLSQEVQRLREHVQGLQAADQHGEPGPQLARPMLTTTKASAGERVHDMDGGDGSDHQPHDQLRPKHEQQQQQQQSGSTLQQLLWD